MPLGHYYVWLVFGSILKLVHIQKKILDLNGASLACRRWPNIECWLCSFLIFQRFGTSIANKPYSFVIFQGVLTLCTPPPPIGSAHEMSRLLSIRRKINCCFWFIVCCCSYFVQGVVFGPCFDMQYIASFLVWRSSHG